MLNPAAFLTANTLATPIQAVPAARMISEIMGIGLDIRMNRTPGAHEKKKGRASPQEPIVRRKSFVTIRKVVPDQPKAMMAAEGKPITMIVKTSRRDITATEKP